jgi:hypothetical protein
MSRSLWRCRNRVCTVTHGAVLGHLTADRQRLVVVPAVTRLVVYLDTRRAEITCPACGTVRAFHGTAVSRAGSDDGVTIR